MLKHGKRGQAAGTALRSRLCEDITTCARHVPMAGRGALVGLGMTGLPHNALRLNKEIRNGAVTLFE